MGWFLLAAPYTVQYCTVRGQKLGIKACIDRTFAGKWDGVVGLVVSMGMGIWMGRMAGMGWE